jgi:AAA domain-containing protein
MSDTGEDRQVTPTNTEKNGSAPDDEVLHYEFIHGEIPEESRNKDVPPPFGAGMKMVIKNQDGEVVEDSPENREKVEKARELASRIPLVFEGEESDKEYDRHLLACMVTDPANTLPKVQEFTSQLVGMGVIDDPCLFFRDSHIHINNIIFTHHEQFPDLPLTHDIMYPQIRDLQFKVRDSVLEETHAEWGKVLTIMQEGMTRLEQFPWWLKRAQSLIAVRAAREHVMGLAREMSDSQPVEALNTLIETTNTLHGITTKLAAQTGKDDGKQGDWKIESIEDLMGSKAVPWLVPGQIKMRTLNSWFGVDGSCKSLYALDTALRLGNGLPWKEQVISPIRSLIISAEDGDEVPLRLRAWTEHQDITPANIDFIRRPINFGQQFDVDALLTQISALSSPPQIIWVDTLTACMTDGDDNTSKDMKPFVASLQAVIRQLDCAMIVIHHAGLTNQDRERGSSVFRNACYSRSLIIKEGDLINWIPKKNRGRRLGHRDDEIDAKGARNVRLFVEDENGDEAVYDTPVLVDASDVIDFEYESVSIRPLSEWSNTIDPNRPPVHVATTTRRKPRLIEKGGRRQSGRSGEARSGEKREKGGRRQPKKKTQIERLIDHITENGPTDRGDEIVKEILPNTKVRSRQIMKAVEGGDLVLNEDVLSLPEEASK